MFLPIPPEIPRDRRRFDAKVTVLPSGCHDFRGFRRSKEYAGFQIGYQTYRAARVIYVWAYGEPNCDLHHTCENAWCVNPEHLVPATAGQKRRRGPSPNYCAHSHEFTEETTYINPRGERQCRICLRAAVDRHYQANRDKIKAAKREARRAKGELKLYEPRPCQNCGELFTPERSTGRFCNRLACWNNR